MAEFGSRNGLLPGDPTVMGDPILADDPRLRGFSKLNQEGLYGRLAELRVLRFDDIANLTEGRMLSPEDAAGMIENHIGEFSVPFGVAIGVPVDDRLYTGVPMVNEETSVIATVGNMAREVREKGHLATEVLGNEMIGQIQFDYVDDFAAFEEAVMLNRDALINEVNRNVLASMVERQGGMTDIEVVELPCPDGTTMAAVHIIIDMCDANGANRINQACEYLKGPLEALTGQRAGICILSNLADRRLVSSEIAIPGFDPEHGRAIARASMLAHVSPHRAATHNKGIMNGVDAVLIATGNDYRAIEAGAHAYAARSGRYRGLSEWTMEDDTLVGRLTMPMAVGATGGIIDIHPQVELSRRMLDNPNADQLARIVTAVGLLQNFGAVNALAGEGITKGHMRLHIPNLVRNVGAQPHEQEPLATYLREHLQTNGTLTRSDAEKALEGLRAQEQGI